MDTEDGQLFVKHLAHFVRTHEKALANALQLRRQQAPKNGNPQAAGAVGGPTVPESPTVTSASSSSTSNTFAAALSLPYLNFASHNLKPAKLALTSHHLFYLLSRFEELGIPVGPMNVRLENLHAETTSANYVSFLSKAQRKKGRGGDGDSIHSVSSVRSVMSGMTSLWSSFSLGGGNSIAKTERQKAAIEADLKYLYSAFTKIPCLRLAPDRRARLIEGYEEFPFDTAVPLYAFKNISALEISDIDIRQFFGWDRLAEQLRTLTVKRAGVEDPADLLINIVLDDMDKRRRRSSKAQMSPTVGWPAPPSPRRSPSLQPAELVQSGSAPASPTVESGSFKEPPVNMKRSESDRQHGKGRPRSNSPIRPAATSRPGSTHGHARHKIKRSGSGSSHSSMSDNWTNPRGSSSNLLATILPNTKWRFLKHLSIADNSLTSISATSFAPLVNTLHSLDLSSNLFTQIPDCLASLTALRALNLSHCMIDALHSLTRNPLPAITALNLRGNRLSSLAGIERLYPLERLDLRDNKLTDPTELARLTGIPELREIWVSGNPFTKTHSNYRVTIFNLFRRSPGYTEDIQIDASGPGYTERRHLVERVAERENVPVVKPRNPDYGPPPTDSNKSVVITHGASASKEPAVLKKERPVQVSSGERTPKRKKSSRRRIVDLSTNESPSITPKPGVRFSSEPTADEDTTRSSTATTADKVESSLSTGLDLSISPHTTFTSIPERPHIPKSQSQPEVPRIDTNVGGILPSSNSAREIEAVQAPSKEKDSSSTTSSADWNISGEIYRKKIEALRNEVGNGWLSVLSEESWDLPVSKNGHGGVDLDLEFSPEVMDMRDSPSSASRNNPHQHQHQHTQPQAIHSGRTLG